MKKPVSLVSSLFAMYQKALQLFDWKITGTAFSAFSIVVARLIQLFFTPKWPAYTIRICLLIKNALKGVQT